MDYQKVFNTYFYLCILGFICILFLTIILCASKAEFDRYEKIRNSKYKDQIIIGYRVGFIVFTIVAFVLLIMPNLRDKKSINEETYNVSYGSIVNNVTSGAPFGLTKYIDVETEETVLELNALKSYKGISKGDYVKVTWLEHSKCAVVEKCDKEE